jgi:hypothetical protein
MARLPQLMRGGINDRLKTAMGTRGIEGAPALATLCDLAESTARAYVNGSRTPSLEACEKIGPKLGVRGRWLFYGEEPKELPIETQPPTEPPPLDLIFAAVEETLLLAGISPSAAAEIAEVVELHVANLKVPRGMTPDRAIRRILSFEVPDILKRQ